MIEALDTYVSFVKQQLVAANAQVTINGVTSAQRVAQVVAARDWPLTPPVLGALYLLFQAANRVGGTEAQNYYEYLCQWSWILIGQDIQANQQASNRGDRYRANLQIMSNLRQANYPGYTRKLSYSVDGSTGALSSTPVQSAYPVSNVESITWGKLRFRPNQSSDSGVTYGVATVSIFAYEDVSVLIA